MAYIDRIHACNGWDPADFLPLRIDGNSRGWVRRGLAPRLAEWPEVFHLDARALHLSPALDGLGARSRAVAGVLRDLVENRELPPFHGELYPVGASRERPELLLDRAMVNHFGVHAHGQHLNGLVRDGGRLSLWIGRRSRDKRNFPGLLDHLAAGGLPHGITPAENLVKECWEEAAIPRELATSARSVGALSYCKATKSGLKPDTIYCYDLELPVEFRPRCNDGEVESFELMPIEQVDALVRDTEEFKPNCSLVIIDLLIRLGRLGPDADDYLELIQGLHPMLP